MVSKSFITKKNKVSKALDSSVPDHEIKHTKIRYFSSSNRKKLSEEKKAERQSQNTETVDLKNKNKELLAEIKKYRQANSLLLKKQNQLQEQYDIQQKILDAIPIPIYYKDIDGRYKGCNKEFMSLVNVTLEDILDKTIFDFHFPGSEIAMKIKNCEKLLLSGVDKTIDDFHVTMRGSERFLMNYKTLLYGSDEKPLYITGALIDITELKNAEKKLYETENKLELILNSMKETVMYLDNEMRVIWTNFKADSQNAGMKKCHNIFKNSNEPCKNCPSVKTRKNGRIETALVENNGKIFEVFSYPVKNSAGVVSGTVEVAMEVTDRENARKYAEEQKEQMINAEKMISLGILVAEAAHEINNPANFIKINSSIIKQVWECIRPILSDYLGRNKGYVIAGIPAEHIDKTMSDLITGVDDGTERIRNIIENLKDYSRNKPPDMSGSFNINFAVQKSIALLNSLIKKSTNRFYTDYASNLPDVRGDIRRIEQVIINVIQNACHSLPDKNKAIILKTFMEDGSIIILVKDEGIGIPPQNIDRVTDPFFTTKDKYGGLGLGLSISKNIIADHKGDMLISSDAQSGTSVKILLPSAL